MADTLYIIDGHSQIYRAYYAPFRDLTSPSGEPTRATHVFFSMLLKLIAARRPTYLAMAMDGPRSCATREAVYPQYKATRPAMPQDLPPQIDRITQIIRAMGIPLLQVEGHEADDIIATLATRLAGPELDVFIVSRDKDLDQLVGEHVKLYDPMKDQIIDAPAILSEKGYSPDKAVEVQTLSGDSIDNIPGIPGVGPKTAAKLIARYGTAEAVVAHADEQTPKLRENLLAHGKDIALARTLVTLNRRVPIDVPLDSMRLGGVGKPAVRDILAELGLNRLIEQLDAMEGGGVGAPPARDAGILPASPAGVPPADKAPPTPRRAKGLVPTQGLLFAEPAAAQLHPQTMGTSLEGGTPKTVPGQTTAADFDYELVDTLEGVERIAHEIAGVARVSIDTETTAAQPMWAEMVGLSLAWQAGKGVYIPVKGPPGSRLVSVDDLRRQLGSFLADERIEKVGQNIKYDLIVLANAGFDVRGRLFDTMVAAWVLDSNRMTYTLSALAAETLNHRMIPIEELIGRGRKQITMDRVDTARVAVYSAEDADVALRLSEVLRNRLAEEGLAKLFEDLEMPLLPVLMEMERTGIIVDAARLKAMEVELRKQADALHDRIMSAAGRPFNPDSPKQLAQVLFDTLKLPVQRRTATGPSTDSEVLEQLAVLHELPGLVLDYRKLTKLIGTYLTALAECILPRTGRVHTDFNQVGAATGRLSSSDPNLQNIPIRTEEGRRIRSAFVAADGCVLLSADYSQVELRVLAHLCQDPTLMAAFEAGQDVHRIVAAEVFGVPADKVSPDQRARAKTVNFGIIYGQTAYGLSVSLRIGRKEAADFIARYRARFPKIDEFLAACVAQAKAQGYVETIFGRRRRIAEIDAPNPQRRALAERLAINSVVQGSAADLIKQAMVNIAARLKHESRPAKMLLQIHDELVFEVPEQAVEADKAMIVEEMSGAIKLRVPLKVDVGVGRNWMEAK
ncbi:MAG: DNA polymerase I [Phycisphaerae bacterium]